MKGKDAQVDGVAAGMMLTGTQQQARDSVGDDFLSAARDRK